MDKPETKTNEEWASQRQRQMKNGQARDKGNIGYTRNTTKINKAQNHTTTTKKRW